MALYLPGNETVSESNDGRPFNFSQISAQEEIPKIWILPFHILLPKDYISNWQPERISNACDFRVRMYLFKWGPAMVINKGFC